MTKDDRNVNFALRTEGQTGQRANPSGGPKRRAQQRPPDRSRPNPPSLAHQPHSCARDGRAPKSPAPMSSRATPRAGKTRKGSGTISSSGSRCHRLPLRPAMKDGAARRPPTFLPVKGSDLMVRPGRIIIQGNGLLSWTCLLQLQMRLVLPLMESWTHRSYELGLLVPGQA